MSSQENYILRSIENTDIVMENVDEIEMHKRGNSLLGFYNINLKVETLVKEILILRKEKNINDAALKKVKDKIEKMDKIRKYEKDEMGKCLAKVKFELVCLEEKFQIFFTKGQIIRLKNNIKRQTWSEDDVPHNITSYAVSHKMQ